MKRGRRNRYNRSAVKLAALAVSAMVLAPIAFRREHAVAGPTTGGTLGSWTGSIVWPTFAAHSTVLPSGRVLTWGNTGGGDTQADLWDPVADTHTSVPQIPLSVFCAGHSLMADGKLFIPGGFLDGNDGIIETHVFDPVTNLFTRGPDMSAPRWYPGALTTGNGEVVVFGGHQKYALSDYVSLPQVYEPTTGVLRDLAGANRPLTSYLTAYYPRMHLAADGTVYMPGDSGKQSWLDTAGSGAWTRDQTASVPTVRQYNNSVLFQPGKALVMGGSLGGAATITNAAMIVDVNTGVITPTSPMTVGRKWQNSMVLPTGSVLTVGGEAPLGAGPEPAADPGHAAVLYAESWDPATGAWTRRADYTVQRFYHSTAVLLPDGRVLSAGGGQGNGFSDQRNAEIYTPWYLYKNDGSGDLAARPTIANVAPNLAYGSTFNVSTPQAASIRRVTLVRLNATTHANDMNQRFIELPIASKTPNTLTTSLGADRNVMPPGHYMLTVVDNAGVPSVSAIVKVGDQGDAPPPTTTTTAAPTTTVAPTTTTVAAPTTTVAAPTTVAATSTTTAPSPTCNVAPAAPAGVTDDFSSLNKALWTFGAGVAVAQGSCSNPGVRSTGSGVDWNTTFTRTSAQGSGTRHTIQFAIQQGDSLSHVGLYNATGTESLQLVVRNSQLQVEALRAGVWSTPASFPWTSNAWYEASFNLDDTAGFRVEVKNLATGATNSFVQSMTPAQTWTFFHGAFSGTTWLDNYMQSAIATPPPTTTTAAATTTTTTRPPTTTTKPPPPADVVVFDDTIRAGFSDVSSNANLKVTRNPVRVGSSALEVKPSKADGVLSLRRAPVINTSQYRAITFWANGGSKARSLRVYMQQTDSGRDSAVVTVDIPKNSWKLVTVPLASLGSPSSIARINIQDSSDKKAPAWYLDELRVVG
jgi:Domain of unknown function (DUF1929)